MLFKPVWVNESNRPPSNWPELGAIEFSNLSISYRPELPPALRNLSISIHPQEKIGIVGRTGAGKSTLTLALFRLVEPTTGSITIDSVGVHAIGLHDLRHKITMIPQDAVIFSGTIRTNLDPFSTFTDLQLWEALGLAHMADYVKTLDGGLEYKCDEHGTNLSAGQKQQVCICFLSRYLKTKQ